MQRLSHSNLATFYHNCPQLQRGDKFAGHLGVATFRVPPGRWMSPPAGCDHPDCEQGDLSTGTAARPD